MPIYSPTGYLDITNATLRTSNIETSNIKIGSANLFITTGNVSDEVFQFTNATTGFVTTGNVEIGGSIIAPDGVTDIKSNLIVEGNVEAAALRLNSVSISPVYTIASGSGAIDFQASPTSLTASANIEVTGNVIAHQFHGDGSGLTGIPPTAITGTLSQWSNVTVDEVYFDGNVGIANTNPGHDLSVGSNLFVDDDGSNVLVVDGNVSATYFEGDGSRLTGLVTTLESVANIGNSTTNVIQFTNETTGFVTDANAVIGSNLTISGLTAQKVPYVDAQKVLRDSYITTSTGLTSIDSNLSVTGNMFVYGERFFIESESQLLKDPIIGLAKDNNVNDQLDIGILMQRPTSNVGIIHHGGTNELTLGYTTSNLTATEIINDLSQELTVNVIGNVVTQNNLSVGGSLKINTISAASSHSLAAVSNVGNTTSNVIQFTNPTTSLVASGNVEVGGNVVADYLYGDGSNISGISSNLDQIVNIGNVTSNTVQFSNATTGFVTTANVEVGGELTVSGNVVVDTNTLFVDSVNNRVGIGTTTPGQKLSIYTGSTNTAALSFDRISSDNYRTDIYQDQYGADFRVGYGSYTPESVLYLKRMSDGAKRVVINDRLGIGETDPTAALDIGSGGARIHGTEITYDYNASYAYASLTGTASSGTWQSDPGNANYGLYVQNWIRCTAVTLFSDARIKKNIVDINDTYALDKLRQLQPKYYNYIDTISEGEQRVIGFIAQEVKDVIPEAVKITTDFIPNIYELSNVSDSNVITLTNFDTSTLESNVMVLKVYDIENKEHLVNIAEVIDGHSIRVEEDLSEWIGSFDESGNVVAGNHLFVYGQKVTDFNNLNKNCLWTYSTAALQEVDRQLQAEKVKVASLETQLTSVLARLDALENA